MRRHTLPHCRIAGPEHAPARAALDRVDHEQRETALREIRPVRGCTRAARQRSQRRPLAIRTAHRVQHVDSVSRERPAIGGRHFTSQPRARAQQRLRILRRHRCRNGLAGSRQQARHGTAVAEHLDAAAQPIGGSNAREEHQRMVAVKVQSLDSAYRLCSAVPGSRRIDDQHRTMLATELRSDQHACWRRCRWCGSAAVYIGRRARPRLRARTGRSAALRSRSRRSR